MPDDTTERWLPVVGFEGLYEVSDLGRVRNARTGRLVRPGGAHGYQVVTLRREPTTFSVHRLVALAHLGPRPQGLAVDHINGEKDDNRVANLEYVTPGENNRRAVARGAKRGGIGEHNPAARLTDAQAQEILDAYAAGGVTQQALAERYGVHQGAISFLITGQTWKHLRRPIS